MSGRGDRQISAQQDTAILIAVCLCFFLSGLAALLYQVAWMRQFSVVFGTSELAVATILATYMGGLALGSYLVSRQVNAIQRPVLVYGLLEALIAVGALAVPFLLDLSAMLYSFLLGGNSSPPDASGLGQSAFYLVVSFFILLVPTAAMGATLPILTRYVVRSDAEVGPNVSFLYAINTAGAVAGTLIAAFYLLPALGLRNTLFVGAAINLVIFIIATMLARRTRSGEDGEPPLALEDVRRAYKLRKPELILLLMMISGAVSFMYEILWTRLLSHIVGSSLSAFAIMLASFLSGIALGSLLANKLSERKDTAILGFVVCQCAVVLTSLGTYVGLDWYASSLSGGGSVARHWLCAAILLPSTLFIGATYPFAVRILAKGATDAAQASARVYAWNTSGAIVGAVFAGFVLIPALGFEGSIKLAVAFNFIIAIILAIQFAGWKPWFLFPALAGLAAIVIFSPGPPESVLRMSPFFQSSVGNILYSELGRSSSVLVLEQGGKFNFRNNGLPEASVARDGAAPARGSTQLLSTLPALARPQAKSMMIIGMGGGVVLENMPPNFDEIDVIELESKIVEANLTIRHERAVDPLADKRLRVIINDARNALALTEKKYDAIVSQPSHPWTAGASHLFTQEFLQLVHRGLSEQGVLLQWMNATFVDLQLLRDMTYTLLSVFEYVRIYHFNNGVLSFLASDSPLDIENQMQLTGEPFKSYASHYYRKGFAGMEDVLAALLADEEGARRFAVGGRLITDDFNRMATESDRIRQSGSRIRGDLMGRIWAELSPLFRKQSWVYKAPFDDLDYVRLVHNLQARGAFPLATWITNYLNQNLDPQAITIIARREERAQRKEESIRLYTQALRNNPDDQYARFALIRPYLNDLDNMPANLIAEIDLLPQSAQALVNNIEKLKNLEYSKVEKADSILAQAKPADQVQI